MKKIIILLLVLAGFNLTSQTSCANAQPFCAGGTSGLTFPASTGIGSAQPGPNYGCLATTPNPAWYYLQINQSGNLDILIQGQIGSGPGQDVDFIAWGPFSSLAGICNSLTAGNTIDCSYSASFTETLNIVGAVAGQYYMVLITNFANVSQNIVFNQYAGNGSTNCQLLANNSAICAGASATIVANNSTNLTNPSYSLNPGGMTSPTPTFVVSPTSTTQYTVYVTGTNQQSVVQTITATANVTVNPQPQVSPTFTQASCTSSYNAVNLNLSGAGGSYTVAWSPQPGSNPSPTTFTASNLQAGTTNVTVTSAGGCSTTASFTMAPVPGTVTFAITPPGPSYSITCNTPTLNLTVAPTNYTYSWLSISNPSMSGTSVTFGPSNQGNWTVTATDPITGCQSAPQTFTIGQDVSIPSSTVSPVSQVITCNTGAVTFTGTALSPTTNIEHQWYCPSTPFPAGPPNFTSNGVISVFPTNCGPGTYTYVLKDLTNGCIITKTVSITSVSGFPTFQTSSTTNYSVGCSPLHQTTLCVVNAVSVNSAAVQFLFLPPGTATAIPTATTAFGALSCTTLATPGPWTVVVQDPSNGCQTAMTIPILQNTIAPHVEATFSPIVSQTLTCFNPTLLATGASTTPGTSISWQVPSTPPVIPSTTIQLGPSTGPATHTNNLVYANYTVVASNTVNACTAFSVVSISQNFRIPTPSLAVGNPSVINCNGQPVVLSYTNNAANSGILGAVGVVTSWMGPAPQTSLSGVAQYSAYVAGPYTLTVQDNKNGCYGSKTYTVVDRTQPPVILNPTKTATLDCGNGTGSSSQSTSLTVVLSSSLSSWSILLKDYPTGAALGPGATGTAVVNQPNGVLSTGNTTSQAITTDLIGTYVYIVINNQTGCRASGVINVVPGGLTADFTPDATTGFAPLNVNFTNNSSTGITTNSITSLWSFGNGTSQTTTTSIQTSATYTAPGTYTVTLLATKGSCIDTAFKIIKIDAPSKIEVPNVFTPNGDGSNDEFFLRIQNVIEINMLIFDRWGNKVYDVTSNTGNIAWDGKNLDGKECAAGTYFYILKATGKDVKTYDQKGNVSLYR
ncbi:MAG: hypothetical protein K0S32_4099 [Bacteroidetes bacterium]|jgi:gliding motility-associated-like protein|nr:hypothetical protein [Bacteroidota bacterium]